MLQALSSLPTEGVLAITALLAAALALGCLWAAGAHRRLRLKRDVLDVLEDAVIVTDAEGRVLYFNRTAERNLGWTEEEAVGRDIVELAPSEMDRKQAEEIMERLGRGEPWSGEMRLRRKDGSTYPARVTDTPILDRRGRVRAIVEISVDLTERKGLEEELRRSREHLDRVIGSVPVVLYALDDEGVFTLSRGKGLERVGLDEGELVGRSGAEVYADTPFRTEEGTVLSASEVVARALAGEAVAVFSAAGDRLFDNRIAPLRHPDGSIRGVVGVALDVTEGKRTEEELRESRERLRALAQHLQVVREEEQVRIAREIHDVLGQSLTAMGLELALLRQHPGEGRPPAHEALDRLQGLVRDTAATVRRIAAELRPAALDEVGLVQVVESHLAEFGKRTGLACALEVEGRDEVLPPPVAMALFRILQEALTNVVRHADASRVEVLLALGDGDCVLQVTDDGSGPGDGGRGPGEDGRPRLGILGMKERARALGGEVRVEPGPSSGTRVRATIPCPEEER